MLHDEQEGVEDGQVHDDLNQHGELAYVQVDGKAFLFFYNKSLL